MSVCRKWIELGKIFRNQVECSYYQYLEFFKNLITLNLTVRPCLEVTIPNLFSPAKLQWSIFDHLSLFHFVIYINLNVYVWWHTFLYFVQLFSHQICRQWGINMFACKIIMSNCNIICWHARKLQLEFFSKVFKEITTLKYHLLLTINMLNASFLCWHAK